MWKSTPVIGGNVGGIKYQIDNGENGFLVEDIDEAALRIVELVKDRKKAEKMGQKARRKVEKHYLLTRYLEQYLDLISAFHTNYTVDKSALS
jgi:trehalose synthase